jgi:hypothetical protein
MPSAFGLVLVFMVVAVGAQTLGPAASCAVGSNANSCCTVLVSPLFGSGQPDILWYYLSLASKMSNCMERPTVTWQCQLCPSAMWQTYVDHTASRFDALACWGGAIAEQPGAYVYNLPRKEDYAKWLQLTQCTVPFMVDGGYTDWSAWSECVDGQGESRTRVCTNPTPTRGGRNCTELGPSVQTRPCILMGKSSSSSSSTGGDVTFTPSSTAIVLADDGASSSTGSIAVNGIDPDAPATSNGQNFNAT